MTEIFFVRVYMGEILACIYGEIFVCVKRGKFLCAKRCLKNPIRKLFRIQYPTKPQKTRKKWKLWVFLLYNGKTYFKGIMEIETAYYRRNT